MPQFIGREDWLQRFQGYLQQQQGVIWRVTGQPGIGKSTLLRQFEYDCEQLEYPNAWLDLENFTPAHGLEVLIELARAKRFFDVEKSGKTWKEKVGEGYKTVSDGFIGVLTLGKDFIPGGEITVEAAKVLVSLGEGAAGSAAQMSENAAAANPELYLLEALAKAGEKHPVLLVDTYEHILRNDLKVQSRLVLGYGQAREGSVKTLRLSEWLHELFEYLQAKGWRIVMAGREVPRSKPADQLPRFSRDEVLQAARIRPALAEYLPAQESAIASVLSTLSFDGNPLWLQVAMNLLENLLAEGKDLAQLAQQPDHLHACFETDDPFDTGAYDGIEHGRCKLTLINTLTRHIGDLEDQAWKIALPRVLDKGIVMQLFAPQQANAILHNFKLAGVFRVAGQQFTLHEEIRDLLLAYARSKGWLDTDETRALHGKLWDYLNQQYENKLGNTLSSLEITRGTNVTQLFSEHEKLEQLFPRLWMLEACYHRCLSGVGLAEKGVSPRSFAYALMGSASLTAVEKWQFAQQLPNRSILQISEVMRILEEETEKWVGLFGRDVTTRLLLDIAEGKVGYIGTDITYWEQQVRLHGLYGDFRGLYFVLDETETNPERLVEVVDEMLHRYGESAVPGVQEQCAKALVNKGVTLGEKLNDPAGAVAVYDELPHRYGDSTVPGVQEQCATALVNKGVTLGEKLNDPAGAVAVYDELPHRYGESAVPGVQEQCAKALVNKGWTLANKLNDPAGAVAVYDALLHRYGDSVPGVQEQCATALVNKGVTLANKLNDPAGAVAVYDDLLQRYGDSTVPGVQEQCAKALRNKGVTLGEKLNDPAGAVAVYDDLLQRYGDSTVPGVQEQCATALRNKGWTLRQKLNDPAGAVAVYDDLLHRYGDSTVPGVQEQCAKALFNKGWTLGEKLNDPAGEVVVYDDLLHRYGDSTVPGVQEQCATALRNKGWTLANKLNDPAGAVAVYDALLHRFGDSTIPGVQEQCATALHNKGWTLNRMDNVVGAVACYDELLARYNQSENPAIQTQCQSALANTVEPLLVWGRNAEAIPHIRQVLARTDATNQKFAIMRFLLWLAEADTTLDDVLTAIRALSPAVEFAWNWDDIRPLVDKLPEPRKTQAECFIAFFEQHHDIAQLESCLENAPEEN